MAEINFRPTLTSNGLEAEGRFRKLVLEQLDETILNIIAIAKQFESESFDRMLARCHSVRQIIAEVEPTGSSSARHIDAFKQCLSAVSELLAKLREYFDAF
jgi:hypothetical protein